MADHVLFSDRDHVLKINLSKLQKLQEVDVVSDLDISELPIYFTVRRTLDDEGYLILKRNAAAGGSSSQILAVNPTSGIIHIFIDAADTDGVSMDNGWFDVVIVNADGKTIQAVPPTRISIYKSATRI